MATILLIETYKTQLKNLNSNYTTSNKYLINEIENL